MSVRVCVARLRQCLSGYLCLCRSLTNFLSWYTFVWLLGPQHRELYVYLDQNFVLGPRLTQDLQQKCVVESDLGSHD